MDLSIVIPVYNEEKNIIPVVDELKQTLDKQLPDVKYEIIVVDDCSKDNTASILKSLVIKDLRPIFLKVNKGKSSALIEGFNNADGTHILTFDGDGQFNPAYVPGMYSTISNQNLDVLIGSKYFYKTQAHDSKLRDLLGRAYNFIVRFLFRVKITDIQGGFKIYKRQSLQELMQDLRIKEGFNLDTYLIIKAVMRKMSISEVPIVIRKRFAGKSEVKVIKTVFELVEQLFKIYFMRRKYL